MLDQRIPFDKKATTVSEQIQLLSERGLQIDNDSAQKIFSKISYYRLTAYLKTFQLTGSERFAEGTSLDEVYRVYCFDRKLKYIIFQAIEKLENAIKAQVSNRMSLLHGAHWYLDPIHFDRLYKHDVFLANVKQLTNDLNAEHFIKRYREKYEPEDYPASWLLVEVLSFGEISRIMESLAGSQKNYQSCRKEICDFFDLPHNIFISWMRSLNWLRNVCAHHGKLWNRTVPFEPKFPGLERNKFLKTEDFAKNKLYALLCCVQKLIVVIEITPSFKPHLKELLSHYPEMNKASMGFPEKWEEENIWK